MEYIDDDNEQLDLASVNIDMESAKKAVYNLLQAVGEDPEREGLRNTPDRVARMYAELLSGYVAEPAKLINGALFNINYDEMEKNKQSTALKGAI